MHTTTPKTTTILIDLFPAAVVAIPSGVTFVRSYDSTTDSSHMISSMSTSARAMTLAKATAWTTLWLALATFLVVMCRNVQGQSSRRLGFPDVSYPSSNNASPTPPQRLRALRMTLEVDGDTSTYLHSGTPTSATGAESQWNYPNPLSWTLPLSTLPGDMQASQNHRQLQSTNGESVGKGVLIFLVSAFSVSIIVLLFAIVSFIRSVRGGVSTAAIQKSKGDSDTTQPEGTHRTTSDEEVPEDGTISSYLHAMAHASSILRWTERSVTSAARTEAGDASLTSDPYYRNADLESVGVAGTTSSASRTAAATAAAPQPSLGLVVEEAESDAESVWTTNSEPDVSVGVSVDSESVGDASLVAYMKSIQTASVTLDPHRKGDASSAAAAVLEDVAQRTENLAKDGSSDSVGLPSDLQPVWENDSVVDNQSVISQEQTRE